MFYPGPRRIKRTRRQETYDRKMGDTNDLVDFVSASLGATLDEIYQRLIDCDFAQKDPGLTMFALLNALGRDGRGNRSIEVVLILAYVSLGPSREVKTD